MNKMHAANYRRGNNMPARIAFCLTTPANRNKWIDAGFLSQVCGFPTALSTHIAAIRARQRIEPDSWDIESEQIGQGRWAYRARFKLGWKE